MTPLAQVRPGKTGSRAVWAGHWVLLGVLITSWVVLTAFLFWETSLLTRITHFSHQNTACTLLTLLIIVIFFAALHRTFPSLLPRTSSPAFLPLLLSPGHTYAITRESSGSCEQFHGLPFALTFGTPWSLEMLWDNTRHFLPSFRHLIFPSLLKLYRLVFPRILFFAPVSSTCCSQSETLWLILQFMFRPTSFIGVCLSGCCYPLTFCSHGRQFKI